MKKFFCYFLITLSLIMLAASPALTNPRVLGSCFIDSLNGKERKQLAKWIYFAIASHPEMEAYSNISQNDRIVADKDAASLITRLLTEDCAMEFKQAMSVDPSSLNSAFELVGQVAMQELMNNQKVSSSLTNYGKYLDQDKINSIMSQP